jgi:hypothetical protein
MLVDDEDVTIRIAIYKKIKPLYRNGPILRCDNISKKKFYDRDSKIQIKK